MTVACSQLDPRLEAKLLYWQGYRVAYIARKLGQPPATVHSWKKRDEWDTSTSVQRTETSLEVRLAKVIALDEKTAGDLREVEVLTQALERTARIRRYDQGGNEADLNPKLRNRNRKRKSKPTRNEVPEEALERLEEAFHDELFGYQTEWWKQRELNRRIRNILKSRQVGATYYFAREAFIHALRTGRNKIFLSASKNQAHVFRQYIVQFAREVGGIDLTGDPIVLPNGAHLYFLGTNFRTAQSYHGDLYIDEYFWIQRFKELNKVASGMAMHKQWTKTYFSTPSSITHEAYPFWDGSHFNRGRKKDSQIVIDTTHANLKDGLLCEDRQWRHIVTVEDAVAQGCDLFDLDELRLEYSQEEYDNLLMCQFIDDTASIFSLAELQQGMVDTWVVWNDWKPFSTRPFAQRPVWIGYDPSRTTDDASCVVLAPPLVPGGKFRILEKYSWRGMDFPDQAEKIRALTKRFNVQHIGIDITGIGYGVYDLVKKFYPGATKIKYSPEVKTRLVLKAKDVIGSGRLEFDAGWTDVPSAFLMIRKTLTASGNRVTYEAARSNETGHADLAWATMHALDKQPLQSIAGGGSGSILEIY
ncbi:terminase large subunit domain-containing protein [Sedimenticola hydrogenitrophicus]|uniref:terminase large subunit domain-containing protein n=1 Tax=Sedimenticola hydrogenitrophicus TaxID=2967975 RepID=UPI0023B00D8F|nr:terminase family protein [Sedimenticola hydrogenitrophicus]